MTCIILGDSLAVGVAAFAPRCESRAWPGVGTADFLRRNIANSSGDRVLISLGANDRPEAATVETLIQIRTAIAARLVFWLLPGRPEHARRAIARVARSFGDTMIDTAPVAGDDRVHLPSRAYQALARLTRVDRP